MVCYLQGQGHSEGSFNQIWLFLVDLLNCLSFCNQISLDVILSNAGVFLHKSWIVVFNVKMTVKFQNFIKSLSVLYFLHHRSLCYQTRFVDVLVILLLTKPSTRKWAYTDNITVIKVSLGTQQVGGGSYLPCKETNLLPLSQLKISIYSVFIPDFRLSLFLVY